jgi:murein L,D-transpeptidase YcbB/YkuD
MLRKTSLAALSCFAATLVVVASASAQSASSGGTKDLPHMATAPQPAVEDGAPSETLAPVPAAPPASAPAEMMPPAETTPPEETTAPAEAMAPAEPVVAIDPLVAQVREKLASSRLPDATSAERAALKDFYAERTASLWVTPEGFNGRARHAMEEIARADDWGLVSRAFNLPVLPAGEPSTAALADAEIRLSVAVLKYARYARGGRLEPSQVSRNFDQKPALRDPKDVLETVAGLETPGGYLRSLHPKHPQFELLRQALLKMRSEAAKPADAVETIMLPGNGPVLKLGVEHSHVALLRERLKVGAPSGAEEVYDQELQEAVKAYQRENGMRPDGVVGAQTRAALNGANKGPQAFGSDEQRLVLNMERWRWMPEDMGEFHVWDNIPEFQTRMLKNGRVIHQAKIIVGKPETQTAIFSAEMRNVVFGPEWGVPDSIKVKEILPYLRSTPASGFFNFGTVTDTQILERQNMRVVYNGQTVDASRIDFGSVDIRKYSFIQAAGPANALGQVKFNFPNKHDIYMHDTPMRSLFDKSVRAFSHGCVRVHNPGRFAEIIFEEDKGWSAARVRDLLAKGGTNEVPLTKRIPVHITYFTMVASEDGQVSSFGDIYGHDRRLAAALSGRPMPLEPARNLDAAMAGQNVKEARQTPPRYDSGNQDVFSTLFGN